MRLTPKQKGIVIVIVFIIILILPATYGVMKAYFGKHDEVKSAAPQSADTTRAK